MNKEEWEKLQNLLEKGLDIKTIYSLKIESFKGYTFEELEELSKKKIDEFEKWEDGETLMLPFEKMVEYIEKAKKYDILVSQCFDNATIYYNSKGTNNGETLHISGSIITKFLKNNESEKYFKKWGELAENEYRLCEKEKTL